jgi:hypothetical protein
MQGGKKTIKYAREPQEEQPVSQRAKPENVLTKYIKSFTISPKFQLAFNRPHGFIS